MQGGNALADVLFGDYNPGGRLSISIPRSVGQLPVYYNPKRTGNRNKYLEEVGVPRYCFGYGLSYTTFEYKNLHITPDKQGVQGKIEISMDLTNTGQRAGDEVVQLYVRDKLSSVITYDSQLRGFQRVTLQPGETRRIHFTLLPEDLEMLDKDMHWIVEPGEFEVLIGSSSEDIRLKGKFEMMQP